MHYNVDQAFEQLKQYKITTNKESLRRWLRNGTIKGVEPTSRKEGWRINEEDLWAFIRQRVPEVIRKKPITTNVAKEEKNREFFRAEMWWEMTRKNLFEGSVPVKKQDLETCIAHLKYPKEFEELVWERITEHTWQAVPRIFYLHDAFLFNRKRLKLDPGYENIKDQILFSLIEHVRISDYEKEK
ncbi:hypothetical protein [Halobacillus campisalis]|uniref:Helix-turn-helix domain-containing protein n=1 Tax=Halobacillus campisalis TaxID=435909 RepID=A0ABW2K312_9BACI|nr:hypothetical protein [Halobacillus campisalis]